MEKNENDEWLRDVDNKSEKTFDVTESTDGRDKNVW